MSLALHWFRRDLRLADNTALRDACREHDSVLPVFVFDPHLLGSPDIGAPRVAFLLDALASLERSLAMQRVPLVVRHGDPARVIPELAREVGAIAVFANRDYSPYGRARDERVQEALEGATIAWHDRADLLLAEPWECVKDDGRPYSVFTPYARRWRKIEKCAVQRRPSLRRKTPPDVSSRPLPTLSALGFTLAAEIPSAGEGEASRRLRRFARRRLERYRSDRDIPSIAGTSGLSADLRFGLLSPRQVFEVAAKFVGPDFINDDPTRPRPGMSRAQRARLQDAGTFVSKLCWRDFYHSVLFHFPQVLRSPFRRQYETLSWPETRPEILDAWIEGRTGFPIVDAGMRQLARTGWMHNRLRMITASFLTKILLVDWRVGERVFMRRLVDGDPASNNGGWQWCASTGTDASPHFRIFNPTLQSKRFDAAGAYIRRWVDELADVEAPLIHEPSRDPATLARTGYPPPCVDYKARRAAALELLGGTRSQKAPVGSA